jgi:hypothetical protein
MVNITVRGHGAAWFQTSPDGNHMAPLGGRSGRGFRCPNANRRSIGSMAPSPCATIGGARRGARVVMSGQSATESESPLDRSHPLARPRASGICTQREQVLAGQHPRAPLRPNGATSRPVAGNALPERFGTPGGDRSCYAPSPASDAT